MAETTNKLTVCLIKPGIADDAIIEPDCDSEVIDGVGTFYTAASVPHQPDWLARFFKARQPTVVPILSATARGVLIVAVPVDGVVFRFALLFGNGRHLLQSDVVEERFGLKVVLNSVEPTSLRSIDKLNLGSFAKQSREQIGREGHVDNFGIDIEQDLIRAVTGRSKLPAFGRMISGRDAFAATAKVDVDDLEGFLIMCLQQYRSVAYKNNFDWIDQIEDVKSPSKIDELNTELVTKIAANDFDRIWIAPPEIIDWSDVAGFRYAKPKRGKLHDDLSMTDLVVAAEGKAITVDWLRSANVHVVSAKDEEVHDHWPSYKCLYAEVGLGDSMYLLNSGKWYKISDDFAKVVNDDFSAIPDAEVAVPKYSHANEGEYNQALAAHLANSVCLDADLIPYGGGKSSIEFCDVLTSDRKLIHVKRYGGSSQLSHLFAQGAVSAEMFVSDGAFRAKVNDKVPDGLKLPNPAERPDASQYEVVYGIVSRSVKPLDVPFFSKVTVRNAARRLRSFGYKVSKLKIPVATP